MKIKEIVKMIILENNSSRKKKGHNMRMSMADVALQLKASKNIENNRSVIGRNIIENDMDFQLDRARQRVGSDCPSHDLSGWAILKTIPFYQHKRMISKKDLFLTHLLLAIFSKIGFLPVDFNRKTGKSQALRTKWRKYVWFTWFVLGGFYAVYNNLRMAQVMMFREYLIMDHLAFHIQITTFSAITTFWGYRLFICNPQVDIAIFNQLYPPVEEGPWEARRLDYSTQEWMLLNLPFCLFGFCGLTFVTFYIHDNQSVQFLYSIVPAKFQTQPVFFALVFFETSLLMYYLSVCFQSIFLQVSFFQNSSQDFKTRIDVIQAKNFVVHPSRIWKECMNCRTMQLNINLFNDLNAHIIFAVKIYWLAVAIENYYFGIKFFSSKPIQAVGLLWLGIFHTFLFSIMYDKAFSVPEKMRVFKQEIEVAAMKLPCKRKRDEIRRFIGSIPHVGVKVGSFHRLERESTPNYVDYIAEKVSGLLITFG